MRTNLFIASILTAGALTSCSVSSNFPKRYYLEHEKTITHLEQLYNSIYLEKPIAVAFSDEKFEKLRLEIKRDSLRYIYEFGINDPALQDSLLHYGYEKAVVMNMITHMKRIKCTWINVLDHYVDGKKNALVYMAIRPGEMQIPFSSKKYFILTFYRQPQYYDEQGRLLDKRNIKQLRKVNNELFWRINDRVCYTLSETFR